MKRIFALTLIILGITGIYTAIDPWGAGATGHHACQPYGRYAFQLSGRVFDGDSTADISEIGTLRFAEGGMTGRGVLRIHFTSGPQAGTDLTVTEEIISDSIARDGCGGEVRFTAVWSDGQVFHRAAGYQTARNQTLLQLQSTSPGTIWVGQGVRQIRQF